MFAARSKLAWFGSMFALVLAGCAGGVDRGYYASPYVGGHVSSVSYFYDELAPYGRWFDGPYGRSWSPYGVYADWRPYSVGSWAYSDYGWNWVSPEPWGAMTYHYGRWFHDPGFGWAWVPDTNWGPSWVSWRSGGDWIGWAPLAPSSAPIPVSSWCFVEGSRILDGNVTQRLVPTTRNATLLAQTSKVSRVRLPGGQPTGSTVSKPLPDRPTARRSTVSKPVASRPAAKDVAARRKLDTFLADERRRLEREQANELRAAPPKDGRQTGLRARHAEEIRAFEQHVAREREELVQRGRPRYERFDRTAARERPDAARENGQARKRGNGGG